MRNPHPASPSAPLRFFSDRMNRLLARMCSLQLTSKTLCREDDLLVPIWVTSHIRF